MKKIVLGITLSLSMVANSVSADTRRTTSDQAAIGTLLAGIVGAVILSQIIEQNGGIKVQSKPEPRRWDKKRFNRWDRHHHRHFDRGYPMQRDAHRH